MVLLSAVVPCFNEEDSIPLFCEEFKQVVICMSRQYQELQFELVFVNDGSSDKTLERIKQCVFSCTDAPIKIKWVSFSRNFGKEAALYAGLQHATGDYIATMDADLQDPPSLLPEMYRILLEEDCDNVATRRASRKGEPPVRSFFAHLFYRIINSMSKSNIVDGARDFRLMKRVMVDAILSMCEYNRFSKGIFAWVGFTTKWIEYDNISRKAGKTKWSFFSLLVYSLEGMVAFSTVPLSIASISGIALCFIALIVLVVIVIRTILFGDPVAGWPSLVCIIIFLGGLQLFCIGIMGQYLAKTYLETKRRPLFIISASNIDKE
jgi:glycosyltransferase involved in cell wall biosynthesis